MPIWRPGVAAGVALERSVRYANRLSVRPKEWKRYLTKSINLSLCYSDLTASSSSFSSAVGAGTAAFLCCAYDVVTDWRGFSPPGRVVFEKALSDLVQDRHARDLALTLYDKDCAGTLHDDGLERGEVALEFVYVVTGHAPDDNSCSDIERVGRLLQIVDDVLDYEDDLASDELNCLTSPRAPLYLDQLITGLTPAEVRRRFGENTCAIRPVIEQARQKAIRLAASFSRAVEEPNASDKKNALSYYSSQGVVRISVSQDESRLASELTIKNSLH